MVPPSEHPDILPEAALAQVVDGLRNELARLRSAVDQLRHELQFAVGVPHRPPRPAPVLRTTSLPKDPATADFFDRINAISPEQMAAMRAEITRFARQQTDGHPA